MYGHIMRKGCVNFEIQINYVHISGKIHVHTLQNEYMTFTNTLYSIPWVEYDWDLKQIQAISPSVLVHSLCL